MKKGKWSDEEDCVIFSAQVKMGNQWCEIAKLLPGRTENAVKNRFNSSARKKWQSSTAQATPLASASAATNGFTTALKPRELTTEQQQAYAAQALLAEQQAAKTAQQQREAAQTAPVFDADQLLDSGLLTSS